MIIPPNYLDKTKEPLKDSTRNKIIHFLELNKARMRVE
jgi:hypothetical protein